VTNLTRHVRAAPAPFADSVQASGMAAYMKEKFPFPGAITVLRRQATQPAIPAAVRDFPARHGVKLWPLSRREAAKNLGRL